MSVTGKFTTIYDVIERVRRDGINDFTEEEAKEWIWDIVSLIGEPSHLVDKVIVLPVENARASLPYDVHDITESGIRDYYTKVVLEKEYNIYYDPDNVGETTSLLFTSEAPSVVYLDGVQQTDVDYYLSQIPAYSSYPISKATYKINNGFIYTGFKTGAIEMAYKAFPTDNEDNPMIEDNFTVIRAVMAYISKKVIRRMWLRDEISLQKKRELDQEYSWAIGAAKSGAAIGSIDDMEGIRARMNRLYRDPNMQKIGFDGLGSGEGLNLNTNSTRWLKR